MSITPPITDPTPMSDADYLRLILQEVIPVGGDESSTLFTNEQIIAICNRSNNLTSVAAWVGWNIKAARLALMVDQNDGVGSAKKYSQACTNALKIAKIWQVQAALDSEQLVNSLSPPGLTVRPYDDKANDAWAQIWDVTHIDRFFLPWQVIEG